MYINSIQARTYYKKQPNFRKISGSMKKSALWVLFPFLGFLIYSLQISGYMLVLSNKRVFMPDSCLAEWQMGKNICTAICWWAYSFITSILVMPISGMLNYSLSNPENISPLFLPAFILYILFMMVVDVALLVFTTNLKFASFFKFKAIKYVLVDNFVDYVKFAAIKFVITFCWLVLIILSAITIVGPFLLIPNLIFIVADLNAQFVRKVFKITPRELKG